MRAPLISVGAFLAIAASGYFSKGVEGVIHPPSRPAGLDAHETHAATSLLGQFRTSLSSWLWLRTDLYLHNGTEMRRLSESELNSGERGVTAKDDGYRNLDEGQITGVVPHKKDDFRGFLGDVEREVKTYQNMEGHAHNDPQVALPLYRLMTWVDPQFVPGWVIGASVIARGRTEDSLLAALDFLNAGKIENPDSIEILAEIARLRIRLLDYPVAIAHLETAADITESRRMLSEEEREAATDCFRWLALAYRAEEDFESSENAALRGGRLFTDDLILRRLAHPAPSIYSDEDYSQYYAAMGIKVVTKALTP